MRERRLIKEGSPCYVDYTDKAIQSVADAKSKRPVPCSNLEECKKTSKDKNISCVRLIAQQMANHILNNKSPFEQAVQEEKADLIKAFNDPGEKLQGTYRTFREGAWHTVSHKEIINDIVTFACVIIDRQPDERRPFTKDGMRVPELGPTDAVHNAMLDLDDIYAEVGQRNPFR